MVDSKRYDPTITRFQKHTKSFVSGKTKKGHLNREPGDVAKADGILVKIDKKKKSSNGWLVKVQGKEYWCSCDDLGNVPDVTETEAYLLPKKKCEVEVSIDKASKIYTITKIKTSKVPQITTDLDKIILKTKGNSKITIEKDSTTISGKQVKVENDVKVDTTNHNDLPDEISLVSLYRQVQAIQNSLSDNNDI